MLARTFDCDTRHIIDFLGFITFDNLVLLLFINLLVVHTLVSKHSFSLRDIQDRAIVVRDATVTLDQSTHRIRVLDEILRVQ